VADAARLFAEARGLLAADGILVVTTPNYRSLWPIIEWGVNLVSPVSYDLQHVNKYRRSRLISQLLEARYRSVTVTTARRSCAVCRRVRSRAGAMASCPRGSIGTSRLRQSPAGRGPAMTPGLISIVVPTYNEARNVSMLHDGLAHALADRSWELIVVDDDSPDGTADVVRRLGLQRGNVRCLQRVQERGLCSAVHWGVQAAQGDIVVVMDGDLQHDPALIPRMLEALQGGTDIVSGSRFLAGGRVEGLSSDLRQTLSDYGNRLTNLLLGKQLSDPLTGFSPRRAGCS